MSTPSSWRIAICLVISLGPASRAARGAGVTVQSRGDASILQDTRTGNWTVASGGTTLTIALDPARDVELVSLAGPSGKNWIQHTQPDTSVTIDGVTIPFGSRESDFQFENAATSNDGHRLQLDASFVVRAASLRVTRHIAVADGTPTFEVWTTFQSLGGRPASIADINAFQMPLASGTLHWLTGRQGDTTDDSRDTAFMRQQRDLRLGDTLTLGAQGRSSEQAVPWLAIDGGPEEFYAGLMWSGAWSMNAARVSTGINLSWGLAPMTTSVGTTIVEGPHALFGIAQGQVEDATAALRSYVLNGIRSGRPLTPLVTYNTWFAYGTNVDEANMRREIAQAAALGAELFVVDAGWYTGADIVDVSNFDQGLGTWEVDTARFPNGLKPLTDYAHSLGLKFGIWVEPERVNLSVVGQDGLDESWLATSGGSYDSDHSAQICLASAAGRQWVVDRLSALIDAAQPDYLKWDNNLWVNCDRAGHGHGPADGNFAHVTALYQILDALHQRYPDLLIENCSGGGNRVDFGMLRYTDVAWMDDRTAPSVHVRHNIEGLSVAFPPAYLLSFVTDHDTEPLHDSPDLSLYFRSRMSGALGLCFFSAALSEEDAWGIAREIDIYKNVRGMLRLASASLLTPQAATANGPAWDVLQANAPGGDALVLYAYQDDTGTATVNVKPTDLQPNAMYDVSSVDVGFIGTAQGAEIMANGIDVVESPVSAAHMLMLTLSTEPAP